jgi:hypothetical protein
MFFNEVSEGTRALGSSLNLLTTAVGTYMAGALNMGIAAATAQSPWVADNPLFGHYDWWAGAGGEGEGVWRGSARAGPSSGCLGAPPAALPCQPSGSSPQSAQHGRGWRMAPRGWQLA